MTNFILKFTSDRLINLFKEGQIRLSKESAERWGITNRNFVYYSANVDDSVLISDGLNPNDFEKVSDFLFFEYKDGEEFLVAVEVLKKRKHYCIVFDNLSEFEIFKRWFWDESRESLIYDPDFPNSTGGLVIQVPIKIDEEDLPKFKADIKKCCGWCDETIDKEIGSGFFDIVTAAIFCRE